MKALIDRNTRKVLMLETDGVWMSPYEYEMVEIDPEDIEATEDGEYGLRRGLFKGSTGDI